MYNFTKGSAPFLVALAVFAGVFLAAGASAYSQSASQPGFTLYKNIKGWTVNQYAGSQSSAKPSCSAVHFKNRLDGFRIERFEGGYFFGINGLSRQQQGARYRLAFWFDGDRSGQLAGEASFVRDVAYIDDDWLSHYQPAGVNGGPLADISGKNTLSFAYLMPGNRTGKDEVTTSFELNGSATAILALDECFQLAQSGGSKTVKAPNYPVEARSDCPDDGPRLAGSGVCQGRAVNYLSIAQGTQPMLMEGCDWVVNEASMPGGDYLFYLASRCGPYVTRLEFSAGARFAEISVKHSAMNKGQAGGKIITVGTADTNDPHKNILIYAQNAMDNQAEAGKCRVVEAGYDGWPSDALVVDVSPQEAAKAPKGEPRYACGSFGLDQENTAYWRVFNGFSWFFNLGQDAYQDIDPRSLTVINAADLPKP